MLTQEKSECPPPRDCDKVIKIKIKFSDNVQLFLCVCVFFFVFFFFFFGGRFLQKLRKSVKLLSPRCPSPFPVKNKNNPRELQDEIGYTYSRALY